MRIRPLRLAALLGIAVGVALGANDAAAGVNAREAQQRHRIRAGIADGSLTRHEARGLAREQLRIERLEHRFRADDGRLGPRERVRLGRRLDRSARHVYRARHNDRTR